MDQLSAFGWNDTFHKEWTQLAMENLRPARVIADYGTSLKVALPAIHTAELTGKLAHYSGREDVPKVGDWVAVHVPDKGRVVIEAVIPRHSEIARKVTGKRTLKQVIAANVDIAFVLLALDGDFSVKRLERFLYQLAANNIKPVIVLNKTDKVNDMAQYFEQLSGFKQPIIAISAETGSGVDEIVRLIRPGDTAILLGSSGVGKSTLTNRLLGRETQHTQAVRSSDDTGKHTTVHRELFKLPGGGLLIDTPGIRELQLWGTPDELDESFDDIAALASQCKYTTCQHGNEAGCAVQAALRAGTLDTSRYANYLKMKHELASLKTKSDTRSRRARKVSPEDKESRMELMG